jgi:hypothetical protein
MRECIFNQPLKTWNFGTARCERDLIKECESQPNTSWNFEKEVCESNPIKSLEKEMNNCMEDRSKIWDGSRCISASH